MAPPTPGPGNAYGQRAQLRQIAAWARVSVAFGALVSGPFLPLTIEQRTGFMVVVGIVALPWAWTTFLFATRHGAGLRALEWSFDLLAVFGLQVLFPEATIGILILYLLPIAMQSFAYGLQAALAVMAASGFLAAVAWMLAPPPASPGPLPVLVVVGLTLSVVGLIEWTKRTERASSALLEHSEARIRLLLEQMPVAMWTTDENLVVNSALGAALAELDGDGPMVGRWLGSTEDTSGELVTAHIEALSGIPSTCEVTFGDRAFQVSVQRVEAPGDRSALMGVAIDINDRKRAEEAKTMFLATASHELKTPLTVILGFAQSLVTHRGRMDDEMQLTALDAIAKRSLELNRIVDRLLLSSRIESGTATLDPEDVDLLEIFNERVESFEGATEARVRFKSESSIPGMRTDPGALVTVLDHLLDNAFKYSPDGADITVELTSCDDSVTFAVADKGIGMTQEQAEQCFDRFWQARAGDSRPFGGTGIGLYIVRSLVEGMGGTIGVESTPGAGTTFTVTLPRTWPSTREPTEEAGHGDPSMIREFMKQIGISTGGT